MSILVLSLVFNDFIYFMYLFFLVMSEIITAYTKINFNFKRKRPLRRPRSREHNMKMNLSGNWV
jgi:hypothetical protein